MFMKLKQILKTGSIYKEKTGLCSYRITKADAVIKVIHHVNGKLRTPKIRALHNAIDNLNKWRNVDLVKLGLDNPNIEPNAWLADFRDTEGHFSVK